MGMDIFWNHPMTEALEFKPFTMKEIKKGCYALG